VLTIWKNLWAFNPDQVDLETAIGIMGSEKEIQLPF